jgi:hypothetical protein
MSLKGLRFTLEVDGLPETATAVVSFTLYQNLSTPFHSVSILPATSLTSPQRISLKSKPPSPSGRAPFHNATSTVSSPECRPGKQ